MSALATTETPDAPSAPSLSDTVAEWFGEIPEGPSEPPEPDTTASAAGDDLQAEPATGSEGAPPETDAAGTAAESAGTTPETPAAENTDPLADTDPLTFTVNGRTVSNDGIRVFKEGGAVIRPEALADVQTKLGERESLFERNRAQSVEYQTLAKATEWTDPSSNKTYSGPEAAIEMRIGNATLFAENKILTDAFLNPETLVSLLGTERVLDARGQPIPDGAGGYQERVVIREDALNALKREAALQTRELAQSIREHYRGVLAEASRPAPAPIDFAAEAPKMMQAVADAAKLDPTVLTPQDRAMLARQMPAHVRNGQVSTEWQELVRERIQLRAEQRAAQATLVTSTTKAVTDTAARMAAAARGAKPTVTATPTPPARVPTPQSERIAAEADAFDSMLSASSRAMRNSA